MRIIDADRAIDMIDEWLDSVGIVMVGKALSGYEELIGCIEDTPTLTPPNEWVSVYDRLPEPGERVLATDCGFVGEFYINKRGKWQRYNVNCSELLMALDILYWMPLPAPPDRRPPEGEEDT